MRVPYVLLWFYVVSRIREPKSSGFLWKRDSSAQNLQIKGLHHSEERGTDVREPGDGRQRCAALAAMADDDSDDLNISSDDEPEQKPAAAAKDGERPPHRPSAIAINIRRAAGGPQHL